MKVVLMRHTLSPEELCTQAMMGCQSVMASFEISADRPRQIRMMNLAIDSGHESVVEHAVFTFSVKGVSRALTHQLVRHRIASYSQQSQRHVDPTGGDEWYNTPPSILQHDKVFHDDILPKYNALMGGLAGLYEYMVKKGIPAEDARFVLPNACKTNIVITMNCRELRHFFKLRRHKSAQWEIRHMAELMYDQVVAIAPTIFGHGVEAP